MGNQISAPRSHQPPSQPQPQDQLAATKNGRDDDSKSSLQPSVEEKMFSPDIPAREVIDITIDDDNEVKRGECFGKPQVKNGRTATGSSDLTVSHHIQTQSEEESLTQFVHIVEQMRGLESQKASMTKKLEDLKALLIDAELDTQAMLEQQAKDTAYAVESARIQWTKSFDDSINKHKTMLDQQFQQKLAELNTISFTEELLMIQEDALAKVIRLRDRKWLSWQQNSEQQYVRALKTAMTISKQEHDKVIMAQSLRLDDEYSAMEEKVRQKKKRDRDNSGGFLSWLSPLKKAKPDSDDDSDDD